MFGGIIEGWAVMSVAKKAGELAWEEFLKPAWDYAGGAVKTFHEQIAAKRAKALAEEIKEKEMEYAKDDLEKAQGFVDDLENAVPVADKLKTKLLNYSDEQRDRAQGLYDTRHPKSVFKFK